MSFRELFLRLQIYKPPLTAQQYLTRKRKTLFLTHLIVSFHPHTSSLYDVLYSPSFHSVSPNITCKLTTHHSIKRKRKSWGFLLDWTVKIDANRRKKDTLIPAAHSIYSFDSNGLFHSCQKYF